MEPQVRPGAFSVKERRTGNKHSNTDDGQQIRRVLPGDQQEEEEGFDFPVW